MSTVDTNSKLPVTVVLKKNGQVDNVQPVSIGGTSSQVAATMTGLRTAEIAGMSAGHADVNFLGPNGSIKTEPVDVVQAPDVWTIELTVGAPIPK